MINRQQRVSIDSISSNWLTVTSGVPQGSILGPILFSLYTNNLDNNLSQGTKIALYADDAKIYRPIHSFDDCRILQSDLWTLQGWSRTWKLSFNATKCQVLSVARTLKYDFNYYINNNILQRTASISDLGVTVSSNLSWKEHIKTTVSKANRLLGLIKRTLGFTAPMKSKLLLYKSLVRSTLMYASIIWHPDKGDLALLEGVQRRATKYILNDHVSDYKTRLLNIGLLPLSYFKEINDLCFFFKCIYNFSDLDLSTSIPFQDQPIVSTRQSTEPLRLIERPFRTETASRFFSYRIVTLWNSLPSSVRSTLCTNKSILPFKNQLYKIYNDRLLNLFDQNNTCTWVCRCRCANCRPV